MTLMSKWTDVLSPVLPLYFSFNSGLYYFGTHKHLKLKDVSHHCQDDTYIYAVIIFDIAIYGVSKP